MRIPLSKQPVDRNGERSIGVTELINLNPGLPRQLVIESLSQQSGIRPQACRYICYPTLDGGFECSVTCTF